MTNKEYYDINLFLLGEEVVPVTATKTMKNLGWLKSDVDEEEEDVEEGDRVCLPFWLALEFVHNESGKVERLPKILDKTHMNELEATNFGIEDDKYKTINLKDMSRFYFDLGITYLNQFGDDENTDRELRDKLSDLSKSLGVAFRKRFNTCLVESFFSSKTDEEDLENTRTTIESDLYQKGRMACAEFDDWERHGFSFSETKKRSRKSFDANSRKRTKYE